MHAGVSSYCRPSIQNPEADQQPSAPSRQIEIEVHKHRIHFFRPFPQRCRPSKENPTTNRNATHTERFWARTQLLHLTAKKFQNPPKKPYTPKVISQEYDSLSLLGGPSVCGHFTPAGNRQPSEPETPKVIMNPTPQSATAPYCPDDQLLCGQLLGSLGAIDPARLSGQARQGLPCMYVCMYVCMLVILCIYIYI